jgi:hypothetical protein
VEYIMRLSAEVETDWVAPLGPSGGEDGSAADVEGAANRPGPVRVALHQEWAVRSIADEWEGHIEYAAGGRNSKDYVNGCPQHEVFSRHEELKHAQDKAAERADRDEKEEEETRRLNLLAGERVSDGRVGASADKDGNTAVVEAREEVHPGFGDYVEGVVNCWAPEAKDGRGEEYEEWPLWDVGEYFRRLEKLFHDHLSELRLGFVLGATRTLLQILNCAQNGTVFFFQLVEAKVDDDHPVLDDFVWERQAFFFDVQKKIAKQAYNPSQLSQVFL